MSRKRRVIDKRTKKEQNVLVVAVEGETEANYIKYVKSVYKKNIKIDIIQKNSIKSVSSFLKRYAAEKGIHHSELVLIYDLENDTKEYDKFIMNGKLRHSETYLSQPCIEYYFLLHQSSFEGGPNLNINAIDALKKLERYLPNYSKGLRFNWKSEGITKDDLDFAISKSVQQFSSFDDSTFSMLGLFINKYLREM
ncbi:MAG: RloB domain-containing protein [Erysipelothrix sp.]